MKNRIFIEHKKNNINNSDLLTLFDDDIGDSWNSIDESSFNDGDELWEEDYHSVSIHESDFYDEYNYDQWVN